MWFLLSSVCVVILWYSTRIVENSWNSFTFKWFFKNIPNLNQGSLCGTVVNMLDCNIVISKSELLLHYCIHFWTNTFGKDMYFFIPPPRDALNSTATILQVLQGWLWHWITHEGWYAWNKETKPTNLNPILH